MTPSFQLLPLVKRTLPFNNPDWLFEIKWDGFRSLLYVEDGRCDLISRKGNEFKSFPNLNAILPFDLKVSAVMDGEIVCLDPGGKSQFRTLLFRRDEPRFIAFNLLWCEGEALRYVPLLDRKRRLRALIPPRSDILLYCDHIEHQGEKLFQLVCQHDLEGIVAKKKNSPYLPGHANWVKIRNREYSQWAGRADLFERERKEPLSQWDSCALAATYAELEEPCAS